MPIIDHYSNCTVCTNGQIEVRRQDSTGRVFAACRECLTGYWTPDMTTTFRTEDASWSSSEATLDEARRAGWPTAQSVE